MYWHRHRLENHLGRYSLVGTTVHYNTPLPAHLIADEKHRRINGLACADE